MFKKEEVIVVFSEMNPWIDFCIVPHQKEDINKDDLENYCISFNNFGYELLNEIFQALGIDSELV